MKSVSRQSARIKSAVICLPYFQHERLEVTLVKLPLKRSRISCLKRNDGNKIFLASYEITYPIHAQYTIKSFVHIGEVIHIFYYNAGLKRLAFFVSDNRCMVVVR